MKKITLISLLFILIIKSSFALTPSQSAVASSHPLATQAGIDILKQGGNAFDAAITVAAVLAVVEPYQSGLGGGGFWLLHDARNPAKERTLVVDARERAPLAAKENMFIVNEKVSASLAQNGPLAAAIPGEPAGLAYLALNFGKLPLKQTLAPAIKLANEGFALDAHFIKYLKSKEELIVRFPSSSELFLKNGKTPEVGTILKQPDLGRVLMALAREGHSGFYTGSVANLLVDDVKKNGGIWVLEDLKKYKVIVNAPLEGKYHQMNIQTVPLPSAGGMGLLGALNILSDFELKNLSDADQKHLIVESLRQVYCDRIKYLDDPEFTQVDVEKLMSSQHAKVLRAAIQMNHVTPSSGLECEAPVTEKEHTTHYSILDQQGNAVAATLTNNQQFGSGFVAQGTGVLLNNGMDDFSVAKNFPNAFGLIGLDLNRIAPGKRPLSSMTPTLFEIPQGVGIVGTPGGSRIPSMMLLALLTAREDYFPQTWVMTPRFHHQYIPDVIEFEPEAFSEPLQHALKLRGHTLKQTKKTYGNMQAIFWDKKNNKVYAASDPRGQGSAVVETIKTKQ